MTPTAIEMKRNRVLQRDSSRELASRALSVPITTEKDFGSKRKGISFKTARKKRDNKIRAILSKFKNRKEKVVQESSSCETVSEEDLASTFKSF